MTKANNLSRSYEEHLTREEFRARFEAEKARAQRKHMSRRARRAGRRR